MRSNLRVLCGTWNVNGQVPTTEHLYPWLCSSTTNASSPHIVAISLQELVDLKALKHYVNEDQSRVRLQLWCNTVVHTLQLAHGHQFSIVAQEQMVGTCILVVCQTQLLPHIRHVAASHVATGKFGVMGNKGGCAIRFSFMDRFTFCFVGVHLSAHQDQSVRRTMDWENVLGRLSFVSAPTSSKRKAAHQQELLTAAIDPETNSEMEMRVMDHDLIFALGDFNYRLDFDSQSHVLQLIARGEYAKLLERDQLLHELRVGKSFEGFKDAAEITFAPTFKYHLGTVDCFVDKRIPAWCDRVLVNCNPHLSTITSLRCATYRSCGSLVVSDHKPVAAEFEIRLASTAAASAGGNATSTSRSRSVVFFPEIDQQLVAALMRDEDENEHAAVAPLNAPLDYHKHAGNLVDFEHHHVLGPRCTSFDELVELGDCDEEQNDDDDDVLIPPLQVEDTDEAIALVASHRHHRADNSNTPAAFSTVDADDLPAITKSRRSSTERRRSSLLSKRVVFE